MGKCDEVLGILPQEISNRVEAIFSVFLVSTLAMNKYNLQFHLENMFGPRSHSGEDIKKA